MDERLQAPHRSTSPAILVADDQGPIRRLLVAQLTARGYRVHEAGTGEQALQGVSKWAPDLLLLDLGLPDLDGNEVTRRIRRHAGIPVIILSVRTAQSDKIAALDAGADDYLTKPWDTAELMEHIRTALLRNTIEDTQIFRSGGLTIDLAGRDVQIDNRQVQLTTTEYELLRVFVLNAGRLMTQRRLTGEIWGGRHDEAALQLLRTTIGSLRGKLERNPTRPRHITTEPGVGFRMRTEP